MPVSQALRTLSNMSCKISQLKQEVMIDNNYDGVLAYTSTLMGLPFEDVAVYCQFCAEVIFLAFIHTQNVPIEL